MRVKLGIIGGTIETFQVADGTTVGALLAAHGPAVTQTVIVAGVEATHDRVLQEDELVLVRRGAYQVRVDVEAVVPGMAPVTVEIPTNAGSVTAHAILARVEEICDAMLEDTDAFLATADGRFYQDEDDVPAGSVLSVVHCDHDLVPFDIQIPQQPLRQVDVSFEYGTETIREVLGRIWANPVADLIQLGQIQVDGADLDDTIEELAQDDEEGPFPVRVLRACEIMVCDAAGASVARPYLVAAGQTLGALMATVGLTYDPANPPRLVEGGTPLATDFVLAAGRLKVTNLAAPAEVGIPVTIGFVGSALRRLRVLTGDTVADAILSLDANQRPDQLTIDMNGAAVTAVTPLVPNARIILRAVAQQPFQEDGPAVRVGYVGRVLQRLTGHNVHTVGGALVAYAAQTGEAVPDTVTVTIGGVTVPRDHALQGNEAIVLRAAATETTDRTPHRMVGMETTAGTVRIGFVGGILNRVPRGDGTVGSAMDAAGIDRDGTFTITVNGREVTPETDTSDDDVIAVHRAARTPAGEDERPVPQPGVVNVRAGVLPGQVRDFSLPEGATVADVAAMLELGAAERWQVQGEGLGPETLVVEGQRVLFRMRDTLPAGAFRLRVRIEREMIVQQGQTVADVLAAAGCPDAVAWRGPDDRRMVVDPDQPAERLATGLITFGPR